ncbi:MAG: hypothetical protein KBT45_07700 [Bacteroidales bacterium]|nr:hypothetical protein [Candidatus Colimorpha pelethequi]
MKNLDFEQLESLWKDYGEKMDMIAETGHKVHLTISKHRVASGYQKMFYDKLFFTLFCWTVVAYFGFSAEIYWGDYRYFLAYIVFVFIFFASAVGATLRIVRIHKHNPIITPILQMYKFYDEMFLSEKRDAMFSIISLPFLLSSGPVVFAREKGFDFFARPISYYLPVIVVALVISVIGEWWYYQRNKAILHQTKENIQQYDELINNN